MMLLHYILLLSVGALASSLKGLDEPEIRMMSINKATAAGNANAGAVSEDRRKRTVDDSSAIHNKTRCRIEVHEAGKLPKETIADITSRLIEAARDGNLNGVVNILAEKGADPNRECTNAGWTPLIFAAEKGHSHVVKVLIEKGADPNGKNIYGWFPLHFAAQEGHSNVVKLLIEKGADPNRKNINGWTPLHVAAEEGHSEVVKVLVEKGADPNLKNNRNSEDGGSSKTPLHLAAERGHSEVVKILLGNKADPNVKSLYGFTPLHSATQRAGNLETVKRLIEGGAEINAKSEYGHTPLYCATETKKSEVARFLESKKAINQ